MYQNKEQTAWINAGYKQFAYHGSKSLRIKDLAYKNKFTRTSFYYYFNSKSDFIKKLLKQHISHGKVFKNEVQKENAKTLERYYEIVSKHSESLLFQRQLFLKQNSSTYYNVFLIVERDVLEATIPIVENIFQRKNDPKFTNYIIKRHSALWYAKLNVNNLSSEALLNYAVEFWDVLNKLKKIKISDENYFTV